ncbi:MAG: glycosyltransferase family 2 protein [Bacteroidetes bacterium]|nr:glycosyltransferase family 2 protein [Bacteroidota bacterium]MBU1719751.1 glycosyltransferase family 2 protein [Bacteroidota bacterium]
MTKGNIEISVIIPAFNEEENIFPMYSKLSEALSRASESWEILFIDDGSFDATRQKCLELSRLNSAVRYIGFTRNFGHQAAITAGLDSARGQAIISLDCDMQDPPELVEEMIRKWREGYLVVYGRRIARHDGFFKKFSAILYYRLLHRFSDYKIPRNVGDFRLVDRKVLNQLLDMREKSRYLRGMVAWLGFKHAFVDYERVKRERGRSKFTLTRMMRFAMDGIMNFALLPLRVGLLIGMISVITGFSLMIYLLIDYFVQGGSFPLDMFLIDTIFIFMGVLFLLVWLIGEYVGRILDESRGRPLYVVAETEETDAPSHS